MDFSRSARSSRDDRPSDNTATMRLMADPRPRIHEDDEIMSLRYRFNRSVAPLDSVGKEVTEGVSIDPEVPGRWEWESDRFLIFTPETDWVPGDEYHVEVKKSALVEHMRGAAPTNNFTVTSFAANFNNPQFYIDPTNPDIRKVTTELNFNYPVAPEDLRNFLVLRANVEEDEEPEYDGSDLEYEIIMKEGNLGAYLVSQPLPMPLDDIALVYTLSEELQATVGGNTLFRDKTSRIVVPGMYNFVNVQGLEMTLIRREDYSMEQLLILSTKGESRGIDLEDYLEVWQLPIDHPNRELSNWNNFSWGNAAIVDDQVLESSERIEYWFKETELEYSSMQSMQIQADPRRHLYIRLRQGAPFYGGYSLARDYETIIRTPEFPRMLELMGEGSVLSMEGAKELTLISQGIGRVQVTLYRVLPDQLNHMMTQTRGDIANLRFNSSNFNEYNISEVFSEQLTFNEDMPQEVFFGSIDLEDYLHRAGTYRNGFFFLKIRDVQGRASVDRFIMVTDLGLLCKRNYDNSSDFFVQSVSTGSPVGGATVEVLGRNGLPIFSETTDSQGHVFIPALSTHRPESSPVVIAVRHGRDLSFLPYNDSDRRLNYSNFDTGGIHNTENDEILRAYLFSDRGLYRPGDAFRIGMMLRTGDWSRNLEGTPLRLMITNPRGVQIFQKDITLGALAFEELEYQTEVHFPTGDYQISLYLIESGNYLTSLGSTHVELKEFQPDRLSIQSNILAQPLEGWVPMEELDLQVTIKNLFGTAAVGNSVEASISLQPTSFYFHGFQDFHFRDPYRSNESYQEELSGGVTDENGQVVFPLDLSQFDLGSYRLIAQAKGFEKDGGRSVSTMSTIMVSPNEYMVGWKAEGNLGYIHRGGDRKVEFIAIDPNLELLTMDGMELVLSETRYISVLTRQSNGTFAYESVERREELQRQPFQLVPQGTDVVIDTDEPGNFKLEVVDPLGVVVATVPYTVVGPGNLNRSLESNTELQIRLDKESYEIGETIEVFIKAPFSGSGLITIEQDRVYAYQWFQSTGNSTVQRITLPEGMEGNAYINVSYIRAADSHRIYMNPLSYGAVPFNIDRENRINQIELEVPRLVKPGETIEIQYNTESPGEILLYGVDQGILQVADYQEPEPLGEFLRKKALEVQTYQILDLILPEVDMVLSQSPHGGGAGYQRLLEANLNPFARKREDPVVFWSGILDNPQGSGTYSYQVPDYFNGEIKIFAVAVGTGDVGVTSQSCTVRNDLIIEPTLPLFAAPGDEFILSVNVANNIFVNEESRPVSVEIQCSENLEILEENQLVQEIQAGRDALYYFKLRATDQLGSGDIQIRASTGHFESTRSVSLSIRPVMPYQVRLQTGIVTPNRVGEIGLFIDQHAEFQEKDVHLSYMPLAVTGGLINYLDHYPHRCTEQLTSMTFPYVSFFQVPDVDMDKAEARRKVARTMEVLMSRLKTEGGFGYWHFESYVNVHYSLYAIHFIMEAIEEGFTVPSVLMERNMPFLWDVAKGDYTRNVTLYSRAYAIYLLTRLGELTTNELTELQTLVEEGHRWRRNRALPFMAASFDMLQLEEEAQEVLDQIEWAALFETLGVYDYYQYNSQYLYLVARHFPGEIRRLGELMPQIVEALEGQNFNTINAAWTVMALTELAKNQPSLQSKDFVMDLINQSGENLRVNPQGTLLWHASMPMNHPTLRLENNNSLGLYYQVSESGFQYSVPEEPISQGIEVFSELKMDNQSITSMEVGDQADWVLAIRTTESGTSVNQVAMVALLPGGLEISPDFQPQYDSDLEYMDVREDRVVLYLNVSSNRDAYTIPVQAVSRGSFLYPPLFAQAMYDPTILAYTEGGRFQIEGLQ